jgi:hypothetical protein
MLTVIPKRLENRDDSRRGTGEPTNKRCLWPRQGYLIGRTCEGVTVRVVYSDESGVGGIEKEPITVVTAIVINMDRNWNEIEDELHTIRLSTLPQLLENKRSLKGRLLYSAPRKNIPEAADANAILKRILALPVKYGIAIFYGAVDRKGLLNYQSRNDVNLDKEKRASSYDVAFSECLRRLDTAATSFTNERILWIADRSDKEREPATRTNLTYYRFDQEVQPEIDGIARPKVAVADTIYFGHSAESVALQLADVCCSTITLCLLEKFYRWDYFATDFYQIIKRNVVNDGAPVLCREFASN